MLYNKKFQEWCYQGFADDIKEEKKWGCEMIRKYIPGNEDYKINNQWTTKLCEHAVKLVLEKLNKNPRRIVKIESSLDGRPNYNPDWETDDKIHEVKGRTWCTTGTAGEKILGCPVKYAEIPRIKNKPLEIILVAYQEYEGKNKFAAGNLCNPDECTKELQLQLQFWKEQFNIEFIPFTSYLKKIGLEDGCWFDNEEVVEEVIQEIVQNVVEELVIEEEQVQEEYTEELLKKKKCPELKKICKSKKIRGYSRKKKQELINLIVNKNN